MVNITLASVVPTSLTLAGEPLYASLAGDAPDSSVDRVDGRDLLAIRRSSNPWELGFNPCEPAALGGELSLPQNRGNELRRSDDSSIATLTVDPTADPTIEANETGALNLAAGSGYSIATTDPVASTIMNFILPLSLPTITLAVSPAAVAEDGATNLIYAFSRTGFTSASLTVNYTVAGSATLGTDYTGIAAAPAIKAITFAVGSATATLIIDPVADTDIEADETLTLTLAAGAGYSIGTTTAVSGRILNDDFPIITLAVSPTSVLEDGITNLLYTFSRTGPNSNPLTVNYIVSGTATLGTDYSLAGASPVGMVSFAPGLSTATVSMDPIADTAVEADETVALTLAAGAGYTIGTPITATGTILNDDPRITLSVSPSSVTEDGSTDLIYTFTRTGPTASALTVNYVITGSAIFNDYTGATAAIFFAPGSATSILTINPTADTTVEADETVAVTVAPGAGYTIGTTTAVTGTILNDDLPVITLAVSPASVLEDGGTNLVYTFTRTGPTATALTVNYAITGIAESSDYTGAAPGSGKSITLAAGSATAILTIDPTADTTIEADETVALTLVAGSGYSIGTTGAVSGTISNDDFPTISLAVSPDSVTEDGGTNLIFTFSRTADTSAPLTVSYTVAGSATPGGDYSGLAATPATKSITFAAGSATATLTVDPTADSDVEPDETVELSLAAGTNYTIGSIAPVIGTIIDGQTYTPGSITINGVNLGTMNGGYAFRNGNAAPLPIIYAGIYASPSSPGNGWAALAATTSDRGYFLYWRNSTTLSAARWELNSSGVYTSGIELSALQLLSEEATLSLDLNGDGFTSGLYTINGVNLGSTSQGYAIKMGSSPAIQITYSGIHASPSSPGNGWSAVAATTTANGGYTLYWRNSGSLEAVRWELNSSGAYTSGSLLSASQLIREEMTLNLDLNGDGYISISSTSPGLNLAINHQGYVLQAGSAAPIQITYAGLNASPSSPGAGWAAIAATRSGNGFTLYWRNNNTIQAARWDLDSSGTYVNGTLLSSSQLINDEAILSLDLNGDGYTSGLGTISGVNLGSTSLGYALQTGGGAPVQVTYPGGIASASNPGDGWSALAALPTDNGYAFYWSNSGSGLAARWNLDYNGVYQSGTLLDASQLIAEEMAMNADLNGDAIIGPLSTTIEGQGNASLLRQNDGLAAVLVRGTVYPVSSPFGLGTGDADSTWQMLAAETVEGQNQILWRNNPENFLHVWTLDPSWSWQSSYGAITPSSAAALGLESSFLLDLNADGSIG